MIAIQHEDDLRVGSLITTTDIRRPTDEPKVLEVLERPSEGVVRLRDIKAKLDFWTTLWGLGLESRRVGAGHPGCSSFLVATA